MKTSFFLPLIVLAATSCSTVKPFGNAEKRNPRNLPDPHKPVEIFENGVPGQPTKRIYKGIQRYPKTAGLTAKPTYPPFGGNIEHINPLQFKYAVSIDVPVEALNNLVLLNYIDDWYATPYKYGGSTRQGIDCSAFTCGIISTVFGVNISRTTKEQYLNSKRINIDDLREGDLVFFNTAGGISHVGVYLINNKFVHASTTNGVIISDLKDDYYRRKFLGGGRVN